MVRTIQNIIGARKSLISLKIFCNVLMFVMFGVFWVFWDFQIAVRPRSSADVILLKKPLVLSDIPKFATRLIFL